MSIPPFLVSLLQLLFDLALPGAMCTMVLAGMALRQEGGMNFEIGGRFQRWMLWTVILLTLPQLLAWFAAKGINLPPQAGAVTSPWLTSMEAAIKSFISEVVVGRLVPVLAAFFVLKATLDAAAGESPLASVVAAIFLLSLSGTIRLLEGFNSGGTMATADMLESVWNYLAGTILPEAAGLAVVGAIISYARQRPFMRFVFTALAFLSVFGIWKLIQAMVV